jgi:hypothetical protein
MEMKNFTDFTEKFSCTFCNIKCSRNSEWGRHLLTAKHLKRVNGNNLELNFTTAQEFNCHCGKIYKTLSGLWKHKKLCSNEPSKSEIKVLTNLVLEVVKNNSELLKQNQEFQKQNNELQLQVLDVCQKIQPTTINNSNNHHSNNKTFNLNFFLNEQCKDAMNIMDFVNTFQLQFSDLEKIGEVGYVEGISNIIIDKLNGMDIYKRPIHCSDAKRETMHIKDKGIWEKDTINNDKMRKAIKHITWLNSKLLFAWAADHPGVIYSDHKLNDKYCEMVVEAMGGKRNKTMEEGEAKIIKKISKLVLIDKTNL